MRSFTPTPANFVTPLEPHVAGSSYAAESSTGPARSQPGTTYSGIHADWVVPDRPADAVRRSFGAPGSASTAGPSSPNSIIQTGTQQQTDSGATFVRRLVRALPGTAGHGRRSLPGRLHDCHDHAGQWEQLDRHHRGYEHGELFCDSGDLQRSRLTSAEWIEELPTVGRGCAAHAGQLRVRHVHRHDVHPGEPGRRLAVPIDMVDESGNVIASAGPTSFNGVSSSFTDTYVPSRARLLAGRLRRRDLLLRSGPVLRVDREPAPAETRRRHRADGEPRRLLARRLRRRGLQLRGHPVLRVDTRARAASRRVGPPEQPQRAHRGHGAVPRRQRLLHGGLRRRRLRLR